MTAPEEIRLTEGVGWEGSLQTEGPIPPKGGGKAAAPRAAAAPAPEGQSRRSFPSMRSAVVWAEILGKPKALRGRR